MLLLIQQYFCVLIDLSLVWSFPLPLFLTLVFLLPFFLFFADISFGHLPSCLGTFLGNPKFSIHSYGWYFLYSMSLVSKEGVKPKNSFGLLTCFLCVGRIDNFGSQVISKNLSDDQCFSLFDNIFCLLT
jgi:hypothetical protein